MSDNGKEHHNGNVEPPKIVGELTLVFWNNGTIALEGAHPDPYVTLDLLTSGVREVAKQLVHMAASGKLEQQRIIRPFPPQ